MHPIFTQYKKNGPRWIKTMVKNAINMLMGEKLVVTNGPTSMDINLTVQEDKDRYVLHLLHYIPERRTETIDIIEDIIPLYNIDVKLNTASEIKSVRLVPSGKEIEFTKGDSSISFTVPEIRGHQMVEINY
jgi:hypothetical protein